MARGLRIKPRPVKADSKYHRVDIARFINKIMFDGKKDTATKLVYDALEEAQKKIKKDPVEIFDEALKKISPILEVRSKRIGGAAYQIPVEVHPKRKQHLAMKWLIDAARARKGLSFRDKLAAEMVDAINSSGNAFKKKEDTHRMAEANKALAYLAKIK